MKIVMQDDEGKDKIVNVDPTEFIPQVVKRRYDDAYGLVLIALQKCSICNSWMLPKYVKRNQDPFPSVAPLTFENQVERVGWHFASDLRLEEHRICADCAAQGKAEFTCALCGQRRQSGLLKETFGDLADHLCQVCYETVPAKDWDKKVNELTEAHRYDFD